jgi:hypothetical protein
MSQRSSYCNSARRIAVFQQHERISFRQHSPAWMFGNNVTARNAIIIKFRAFNNPMLVWAVACLMQFSSFSRSFSSFLSFTHNKSLRGTNDLISLTLSTPLIDDAGAKAEEKENFSACFRLALT